MVAAMPYANKTLRKYVCDFETITDPDDCRVWAWGAYCIDDDSFEHGNSIVSFIEWCRKRNAKIFFHNLAFDGVFIIDWLLRHGIRHVTDKPRAGEFSTLIDKMGAFYSITIKWNATMSTTFQDSLKKLPMKVSTMSKAFGIDEVKGSIDYDAHRPVGHVLTEEELRYLYNDCLIVAKALAMQFAQGMDKMTVGADSLAEFKRMHGNDIFRATFPVLPAEIDTDIRKAYRGGFTYADDRFQGRVLGSGLVFDVNSLYPSVMYDKPIPYGEPKWVDGWPEPSGDWPLWIGTVTFTAKIKPDHIPCIQVKGSSRFVATQYLTVIDEPTTLFCTNVDWQLWTEHYDINVISFNGAYMFQAITGVFNGFIDHWMEVKSTHTGGMRTLAKLQLNSLYGKLATSPDCTGKVPVLKNDKVALVVGPEETREPVYTPAGVFITAWARDKTIRAAQAHYDVFAYADTDSLHLITDEIPNDLDVHDTRLGAWKLEKRFDRAVFVRAKQYGEETDGELEVHIAGLPKEVQSQVTLDHLTKGHVYGGKLARTVVPGGVVLAPTTFRLAPP